MLDEYSSADDLRLARKACAMYMLHVTLGSVHISTDFALGAARPVAEKNSSFNKIRTC